MNTNRQPARSSALQIAGLRRRLSGQVVTAADGEWDDARAAWNLAVDQRPYAVVVPETVDDVIAAVQFAAENGLRIAPQGTGHGAAARSWDDDMILLKTERMRGVVIDPVARSARVEAGALWLDVTGPAAEHGLVALHGSAPDVGVVGYTLGGGIGWLARSHGLAANSVLAVELVTADGRLVRADRENDPDLFWAIRGGGGSFGVVTAIEFSLYPLTEVFAGIMFWPAERGSEVLQAWREWVQGVPDTVTSVGRYLTFPPIPDVPEPMRGRAFVIVEIAYQGTAQDGEALVAPLRVLGPVIDTVGVAPTEALTTLHMDPPHPVPGAGDGMLLADAPAEAIDALVAVAGSESGSPLLSVELRHLGGALRRPESRNGALATLDAGFALFAVGIAATPEMKAAVEAHVDVVRSALAQWDSGRGYMNFTESAGDPAQLFAETTYRRLREVKSAADPNGLFVANHPIAAGAARRGS